MSTNIDSHQHFGVPVFEATLADFNDHQAELADYLLSMRAQAGGVERSNMGGWHSDDKLHADKHPAIRWLTQAVYSTASACIRHQTKKPKTRGPRSATIKNLQTCRENYIEYSQAYTMKLYLMNKQKKKLKPHHKEN